MDLTTFADNPGRTIAGLVAASLVALAAMRLRALTPDGAVAAAVTGGLLIGAASWWAGATLIVFFLTSTLLSMVGKRRSTRVRQARGSRRDALQVLANGGVPVLFAVLGWWFDHAAWTLGAVVAIAAAAADTWATEIGRLTQAPPRAITSLRRVPVGTSGAISFPGTAASVAAGVVLGGFAATGIQAGWLEAPVTAMSALPVVMVFGIVGSLTDSLLGATLQERRRCTRCGEVTESRRHACGGDTIVIGGLRGFDNDLVNGVSIAVAALGATWLGYVAA